MRLIDADKLIEELGNFALQESTFGVDEITGPYDAIQECIEVAKKQEEEIGAAEAIEMWGGICRKYADCKECPIGAEARYIGCQAIRRGDPDEVAEVLKKWKADHEKKPVETEMAWYIQIIDASNHFLVHEERTDPDFMTVDEKKEKLLQKWCTEHQGEFYAVSERRCVVRSDNT